MSGTFTGFSEEDIKKLKSGSTQGRHNFINL